MTEYLVSRGDTFPRTFLDNYRSHRSRPSDQLYNELKPSKSDELVLQNPTNIQIPTEINHGYSDNILDGNPVDYLDKPDEHNSFRSHKTAVDKIDPEDSIRDMVTENDFYRFVLFKKHYDKYLDLSMKYDEARNNAYYMEEKYHDMKMERDQLLLANEKLTKKVALDDATMKEKEDELFSLLEKIVNLEEEIAKLREELKVLQKQTTTLQKEKADVFKMWKLSAQQSEANRRSLERARQKAMHQLTEVTSEKNLLEKENNHLRALLTCERRGINKYLNQTKESNCVAEKEFSEKKISTLSSQFTKAMRHLSSCRRKKCEVCIYAKTVFGNWDHSNRQNLFSCFQNPFHIRSRLKAQSGEDTEVFTDSFRSSPAVTPTIDVMSFTYPSFQDDMMISYIDDVSCSSQSFPAAIEGNRVFGSDSGFSSDQCAEIPKQHDEEKFVVPARLDEKDCAKLQRTKWTASFRKLINKVAKK